MAVKEVLEERGGRYGNYLEQTQISADLISVMRVAVHDRGTELETDQDDALTMIAVKISRILNGDPNYADNWSDIAGYATLVEERLNADNKAATKNK